MYTVLRRGRYGHPIGPKGLQVLGGDPESYCYEKFVELERAKKYADSFVHRYPDAICVVHEGKRPLKVTHAIYESEDFEYQEKMRTQQYEFGKKPRGDCFYLCLIMICVLVPMTFGYIASRLELGYLVALAICTVIVFSWKYGYQYLVDRKTKKWAKKYGIED